MWHRVNWLQWGRRPSTRTGCLRKLFMTLFARKMEKFARGSENEKKGWLDYDYESFVDASKRVIQGITRLQQQQVVCEVLLSMLPPGAPAQFRKLFPPTKWAAEFNAALTVYLSSTGWLGLLSRLWK